MVSEIVNNLHPVKEGTISTEPIWHPLEAAFATDAERGAYMFMSAVETTTGRKICLYKHKGTRQYLNIDEEHRYYRYVGGSGSEAGYEEITRDVAVSEAER